MSSRSLNRVTLIGNLTRDPELKYTPQGTAVCTFGVATNRTWVTTTGELKEEAQYHRIVAWQKLAELCNKILAKGKKVYVEGRITYRSYVGKDGISRTITEIILDDFVVLDSFRRNQETTPAPPAVNSYTTNAISSSKEPVIKNVQESQKQTNSPVSQIDENQKKTEEKTDNDEKIEPEDIPF